MKTSKPLVELIPQIIEHVQRWKPNMEFNFRMYKLMEGQIKKEIENSLRDELISNAAFSRAIMRIPPINILKRTTDKLSKLYVEPPRRKAENDTDEELVSKFSKEACLDVMMDTANKFYNGMYSFALEPHIEDGEHKVRVLSPHQFLVFSDSKTDPSKHTVFIKLLGQREIRNPVVSKDGERQDTNRRPEIVDILGLYTDTEFLVIDSNGSRREDIMRDMGLTNTSNPFGRIPFVYGKRTVVELMPFPNQPGLDFSVLIPKLLTDLNYAAQFSSHSITWTKNVAEGGVKEYAPDAILNLGDSDGDGNSPEIGIITPTVDIDQQLKLIEFQFSAHLDSLGIKANASGALSNGRDSSGIAKAIDEGDTSAEKKNQMSYFKKIETELWSLVSDMQRVWTGRSDLTERRVFSTEFKDDFAIEFSEVKVGKSFKQKIEEVQLLRDQKLISRRQALRSLHPEWTEGELDQWLEELDEENQEAMEAMMQAMPGVGGAEQAADGTFNEGNQIGGNQTPESRPNEDEN